MIRTLGPATLLVTGCGAGVPLLHGAHPLDSGEVSLGAGISSHLVRGPVATGIRTGVEDDGGSNPAEAAVGAMLRAAEAPNLAPWVSSRIGIGSSSDAGLTYTGRQVRLDARRAWTLGAWAVSAGMGLGAVLWRQTQAGKDGEAAKSIRTSAQTGFGLDIPVLVGWRSSPDAVQAWTGLRGGYERLGGDLHYSPEGRDSASSSLDASARRWYVGPVVGLAVGVEPVWIALELAAAYQSIRGDLRETRPTPTNGSAGTPSPLLDSGRLRFASTGYALVPSAAFVGRF